MTTSLNPGFFKCRTLTLYPRGQGTGHFPVSSPSFLIKALMFGWVFLIIASVGSLAAAAAPCQVHVILFVPVDVKPPAAYQQRVDEVVTYAEAFFGREFKRWGHERVVMPFRRAANGHVEVTLMRGKEKTAQYKPVEVRAEVMNALRAQSKLSNNRQVWWIMVYAGDPPKKFAAYLGGFGVEIGGWSVCNFDTRPGRIDPAAPLGSEFLEDLTLKGMIHELGHGFQLPHIGPLKRDKAGNTLMGPTHFNYQRVIKGEQRPMLITPGTKAGPPRAHPKTKVHPVDKPRWLLGVVVHGS